MAKLGPWVLTIALALVADPALAMMGGSSPDEGHGMGSASARTEPGSHMGYGRGFHAGPGEGLYQNEAAEAHAHALEEADTDADGALTKEEFASYMEIMEQQREVLIFERLDHDRDGMVGEDEFWRGFRRLRQRRPRW